MQLYGRFLKNKDEAVSFDWSGCTIEERFYGTEVSVQLSAEAVIQNIKYDYLSYSIDGEKETKIAVLSGKHEYKLAFGLTEGIHTVRIVKNSEGSQGMVLTFYGFSYGTGRVIGDIERKKKNIWFIGDSITAGFGTDSAPQSVGFRVSEENVTNTYCWLAAQYLDAAYTATAVSGAGVLCDCGGGGRILPSYFNQLLFARPELKVDFHEPTDIIVINLGTNDFGGGADLDKFVEAYHNFIKKLRTYYPVVPILCSIGPMYKELFPYVERVVNEEIKEGDDNIGFCSLYVDPDNTIYWGAEHHPTAAAHRLMMPQIVEAIRKQTGWE